MVIQSRLTAKFVILDLLIQIARSIAKLLEVLFASGDCEFDAHRSQARAAVRTRLYHRAAGAGTARLKPEVECMRSGSTATTAAVHVCAQAIIRTEPQGYYEGTGDCEEEGEEVKRTEMGGGGGKCRPWFAG